VPSTWTPILELEPTYEPMYRFVDTMLAYRPLQGTEADVRLARDYLERGRANAVMTRASGCGTDNSWRSSGHRSARRAGPRSVAERRRGGHRPRCGAGRRRRSGDHSATMLTRSGASQEALRYLEQAYAFTEHPSMTEIHEPSVESSSSSRRARCAALSRCKRGRSTHDGAARSAPVSRPVLAAGPVIDPAGCAGTAGSHAPNALARGKPLSEQPGSPEVLQRPAKVRGSRGPDRATGERGPQRSARHPGLPPSLTGTSIEKRLPLTFTGIGV